jgi:hypothetical protein
MTQERRRPAPPQNRPISITRYDHFKGMQRRAAARKFCPPISTCGCVVDPDFDRHDCHDDITDVMADAAVSAALHLLAVGTAGIFSKDLCRTMWRRGHPQLAAESYSFSHGEAA